MPTIRPRTPRVPTVPGRPLTQGNLVEIEDAIRSLTAAYVEAEEVLRAELRRVVRVVALDPTSTKRYREQQIRGLLATVARLRSDLDGQAVLFAEQQLGRIYAEGMGAAAAATGGPTGQAAFTRIHQQALEILAVDTFDDLAAATDYLDTATKRTIREATKARVTAGAAAGQSVPQDTRALVRRLETRGVTGFVDAAGRNWRLSTYAEMVVRTKSAHAYNTGTILKAEEDGTGVFRIADGERSGHPECLAYSGQTATAAWALAHPIEHPNCVRAFGPLPLGVARVDHGNLDGPTAASLVRRELPDG